MLKVEFSNLKTNFENALSEAQSKLLIMVEPVFESYKEDIVALGQKLASYQKYQNILLVGNGGSIWSFMSYYTALADKAGGKAVVPVTDMEPDNVTDLKQKYAKENTLVVVISKSGSTVGVIENIFAFWEYEQIYVTDRSGPIGKVGASRNALVVNHPNVGGRYSSFTSSAYVPAILTGLPVLEIEAGGRAGYEQFRAINETNPALLTALALYSLENSGYSEIFLPIYSNFLETFGIQVTQLFHESFGKGGKGLTVLATKAPESQHHTNQRFFGGPKNMIGCFLHVANEKNDVNISIPDELKNLPLRTGTFADIDGINLAESFKSEYLGTVTDAKNNGIPVIDITVSEVSGETVGFLMAFWHYVTVYSSILRNVDPYDQPQVESSKEISFNLRKNR